MKPGSTVDIAKVIEAYLMAHPNAADTAEGIRAIWLPGHVLATSTQVQAALEELGSRGVVSRRPLPDGTSVYCRAGAG